MKILLDECLPLDFRHSFPGHDAHTAEWAGLKGRKNGDYFEMLNSLAIRFSSPPITAFPANRILRAESSPS